MANHSSTLVNRVLPIGAVGRLSLGWWGVLTVIATEGVLLLLLLFSYFYVCVQTFNSMAPPNRPPLHYALAMTGVLILNIGTMWLAGRSVNKNARWQLTGALALSLLLGLAFIGLESIDWYTKPFTVATTAYTGAYYILTGVHLAHVVAGSMMLLFLMLWSALGYFDSRRNAPVLIVSAYWYMVDLIWILYFLSTYAAPYFQ
jgi:cytochrome c oxidase subunit III